jgi:hypothetical protein
MPAPLAQRHLRPVRRDEGDGRGGGRMGGPQHTQPPKDPNLVDISALFFSVALGRSVAQVELQYTGASLDEAITKFRGQGCADHATRALRRVELGNGHRPGADSPRRNRTMTPGVRVPMAVLDDHGAVVDVGGGGAGERTTPLWRRISTGAAIGTSAWGRPRGRWEDCSTGRHRPDQPRRVIVWMSTCPGDPRAPT